MTKPDDIPESVWLKAADIDAAVKADYHGYETTTELIARAFLSEREACAQVAESATRTTYMLWDPEGLEPVETKIDYREQIAAAIRAR